MLHTYIINTIHITLGSFKLGSDSDIMKKVQKTSTRSVPELCVLSRILLLDNLEHGLGDDLIMIFRLLRNDFGWDIFHLFLPAKSIQYRGDSSRFQKPRTNKVFTTSTFSIPLSCHSTLSDSILSNHVDWTFFPVYKFTFTLSTTL